MSDKADIHRALGKKKLWLSFWMVPNENAIRPKGCIRVGGHQASSASKNAIVDALYLDMLRPETRLSVNPHPRPVFHAIQCFLGNQTGQRLEDLGAYATVQRYPSRAKFRGSVDFTIGSVGTGVVVTAIACMTQVYLAAHNWVNRPEGRMIALVAGGRDGAR